MPIYGNVIILVLDAFTSSKKFYQVIPYETKNIVLSAIRLIF